MSGIPELTPVRESHRFDEMALANYLRETLGGDFMDLTVQQFEGGQSNPTFLLTSSNTRYVLRKKPPGALLKSAHAVEREYRVMHALRDTAVPVPKMLLLCEDESVIGTPFFVMEHVEGRVFADQLLPTLAPKDRAALYEHFIQVLAALHGVDYLKVGLEDFGKPGNYYARQISRWSQQYVASKTGELPAMDQLMEWLPANIPAADLATIVHGDYRIGNCIVHPTEPRIVAVLDWELSTIGHPFGDVAYCCMYTCLLGNVDRGGKPGPQPEGIPNEEQFVAQYCRAAGLEGIDNWTFYMVFSLFRSAAITMGVYKRGLDGNASSEQWRKFEAITHMTANKAWELAQQG